MESKEDKNRKDTYKRKLSSDEAKGSVSTYKKTDKKLPDTDRVRPKREYAAGNNRSNTSKRDNREQSRNSNVNRPRNNVTHKTSNVSKTNITKNNVRKTNLNRKNSEEE